MTLFAAEFPGIDGFIPGSRASIMLDVVAVAMVVVLAALAYSLSLVKRREFARHQQIQVTLGIVLLVAVTAFEVDMHYISGWRPRAEASAYYGTPDAPGSVFTALYIHLCCAVPTAVLWVVVIARALKNFPRPAAPSPHSRWHRPWAKLATLGMIATAVTGWIFYALAFLA